MMAWFVYLLAIGAALDAVRPRMGRRTHATVGAVEDAVAAEEAVAVVQAVVDPKADGWRDRATC